MPQHPFEDEEESLTARIDHACLFKDREQLRRSLDGGIRRSHSHLQDLDRVLRGFERRLRCQGHLLGDGKDRPFHRADNALIGGIARLAKAPDQSRSVQNLFTMHAAGKATP